MNDLEQLLTFWLGSAEPDQMMTHRQEWWVKDEAFDQRIHSEFSGLYDKAVAGDLEDWKDTPLGCVGLCILLDQFPRNMFRGTARSFESDATARDITRHVLDNGFDKALPVGCRLFLYLPLEHSENLDHQYTCVALMQDMGDEGYVDFALKHQVIIERFGRFPHRNEVLGRKSTPEEIAFLETPGSSF